MTYELQFHPLAKREWDKLDAPIRDQFKKKLEERLENPHVQSAMLSGRQNVYKIKLRASGFRLAYEVDDNVVTVTVLAVGKRDRNIAYKKALKR